METPSELDGNQPAEMHCGKSIDKNKKQANALILFVTLYIDYAHSGRLPRQDRSLWRAIMFF